MKTREITLEDFKKILDIRWKKDYFDLNKEQYLDQMIKEDLPMFIEYDFPDKDSGYYVIKQNDIRVWIDEVGGCKVFEDILNCIKEDYMDDTPTCICRQTYSLLKKAWIKFGKEDKELNVWQQKLYQHCDDKILRELNRLLKEKLEK